MTSGELDPKIRIRAPLRCDGIGRLDCAEDVDSGMRMAIRWLPLEANGDAAAKAMQQLPDHPTLPKIRQAGQVGAAAYVAMDFPDGKMLSTMLDEKLGSVELSRMGAQIADALASIHAQGVFHGEISADSLLLLPGDKTILWDMPLVIANRLTDRRGEERAMASTVRMAPFLAPERAQGLPPSASGDVYALGAVLCLAAGGRPPSGATTLAIIHQIASGRWTPEVPEGYPDRVRSILASMVNRDALARPSAHEVVEAMAEPMPIAPSRTLERTMTPVMTPAALEQALAPTVARTITPVMTPAVLLQVLMPTVAPVTLAAQRVSTPPPLPSVAPVTVASNAAVVPPPLPSKSSPAVEQSVMVSASVAVTPEMAAVTVASEPPPIAAPARSNRRLTLVLGSAVVIAAALTLGGSPWLRAPAAPGMTRAGPASSERTARPATTAQPEQVSTVPVAAPAALDPAEDVLVPLPAKARGTKPAAVKRTANRTAKATTAPSAPKPEDFGFLESADKPAGELKRPSF